MHSCRLRQTLSQLPRTLEAPLRTLLLGERLRILDVLRDHARELTSLQQLTPLAATAGDLVLRGADRLLRPTARLDAHDVAIACRRDEAKHAVLVAQLYQDDTFAGTREVVHFVGTA